MLFLGEFEGMSVEDSIEKISRDYEVDSKIVEEFELLVLWQDYESYEGSSWFLLKDKGTGKLFENSGGHCSCYGFEGQFGPKETSVEYLLSDNCYFHGAPKDLIKEFINRL